MDANSQRCLAKGTGGVGNVGADVCFGELSKSKKKEVDWARIELLKSLRGAQTSITHHPVALSACLVGWLVFLPENKKKRRGGRCPRRGRKRKRRRRKHR